jgi:SAM-dependent methyltransferase
MVHEENAQDPFEQLIYPESNDHCMSRTGVTSEAQLLRQLAWLKEPWSWLMRTKVLENIERWDGKPSALDVGCGPGLVTELLSSMFDVQGIDSDPNMVRMMRERGYDAVEGDAASLPFRDGSFDIVYCSFTLLWVSEPQTMIKEMARVSRHYVVFLAEPDYGGRICHPEDLLVLDRYLVGSLVDEGADPFIGRKLGGMMEGIGLDVEVGVHSGVWSPDQLRKEANAEWESIAEAIKDLIEKNDLERAKAAWDRALADGSLFLFNPVFYAIGRK